MTRLNCFLYGPLLQIAYMEDEEKLDKLKHGETPFDYDAACHVAAGNGLVAKSINYTVLVVTTNTRRASCPMCYPKNA